MIALRLNTRKGWPYVISWGHRISGIFLTIYLWLHFYTLTLLETPALYDARMSLFQSFPYSSLEWLLSIPVIFHALNGGRLILYESFGFRKDTAIIRLVVVFSVVYVGFLGFLTVFSMPVMNAVSFWIPVLLCCVLMAGVCAVRICRTKIGTTWKLQRITAALLLILVPAHLLFMHLHPDMAHFAQIVIDRLQIDFMKLLGVVFITGILYHAGYGLISILNDYLSSKWLRNGLSVVIVLLAANLIYIGVSFLFFQ